MVASFNVNMHFYCFTVGLLHSRRRTLLAPSLDNLNSCFPALSLSVALCSNLTTVQLPNFRDDVFTVAGDRQHLNVTKGKALAGCNRMRRHKAGNQAGKQDKESLRPEPCRTRTNFGNRWKLRSSGRGQKNNRVEARPTLALSSVGTPTSPRAGDLRRRNGSHLPGVADQQTEMVAAAVTPHRKLRCNPPGHKATACRSSRLACRHNSPTGTTWEGFHSRRAADFKLWE